MQLIEGKSVYSVSEINSIARKTLEQIQFWVEGEISSFSGHNPNYRYIYFDLKDSQTGFKLPCILDPETYLDSQYQFEEGEKVLALGTLTLWEKEAKLQMRVVKVEQFGQGLLLAELEKLKNKLQKLGYFNKASKKNLPIYPTQIAVITSEISEAWQDFLKHSFHKYPTLSLYLYDVKVQGEVAAKQITKALNLADKNKYDVICLIRGGGSVEDLASFNDETLARAIFKSKTPIVVGVGHERDITIASLVADISASTPTDAAKIISNDFENLDNKLKDLKYDLLSSIKIGLNSKFQQLDIYFQKLANARTKLATIPQSLRYHRQSLNRIGQSLIGPYKLELASLKHKLLLVSPQNVLSRGFSITTNNSGKIITSTDQIVIGQKLRVKLSKGKLQGKVLAKSS